LIAALPKAELHIHIEGSLEPEMMFRLAERNQWDLPFEDVDAVAAAYEFTDLQSFLDLYYQGASVLRTPEDFYELMSIYLRRAAADGVRHAEIFFDPQAHTQRGLAFETVYRGIRRALDDDAGQPGLTTRLILCFLRDRTPEEAMATLEQALPFQDGIVAVGLDSAEQGHPPEPFAPVFNRARAEGLLTGAHAGEEGPPSSIRGALDALKVRRIDHGVRCEEDPKLMDRLARHRTPLTVCPLSNVRLGVFPSMSQHNLKRLLDHGLCVTVNSDDPAYFGGYITANFQAATEALGLTVPDLHQLGHNAFQAAFLPESGKKKRIAELDQFVESNP